MTEQIAFIENATSLSGDTIGYAIKTSKGTFTLKMEKAGKCWCSAPLESLVGEKILNFEPNVEKKDLPESVTDEFRYTPKSIPDDKSTEYIAAKFVCPGRDVYFVLSNTHNSYYAHQVEIFFEDKELVTAWV